MTRLLLLGTRNSPHLIDLARDLAPHLEAVTLAGWAAPDLPPPPPDSVAMPPLTLRRGAAPLRIAWERWLVARYRPDVVHVHGATAFATAAVQARIHPLVVTTWGSDVLLSRGRTRRNVAVALRGADAVTADSPMLARAARELGARDPQLLGWGVDTEAFAPGDKAAARRRLGLPDGRLILSARASTPLYNPETVVAAFDLVADRDPAARLVVKHLGDAPAIPSRHPDRVHRLGPLPRERLPDVYRAADVCVSIPSSDSAPRSVWEAMACGCPCVLSDLPWLDGMIRDEAVVTAVDAQAVAAAIERAGAALAERGRKLVEREHDAADHRRRWLELYRGLSQASSRTS